jgi:protein TonB
MHQMQRAGAIALATLLIAACGAAPDPDAVASPAAATVDASADAPPAGDADALRERARQAMQASRMFAPAGDNALEHYLALRVQAPGDASVDAALVDLQPQLVIAIEQAIARGEYPEGRRLLGLLARTDAQAPALPRLRETVASAETAARDRELAVDADARAKAEQAEAELRRVAQESAARLAAERSASASRPAASAAPPTTAPAQAAADTPAVARVAVDAPARSVSPPPPIAVEPVRQVPPPPAQVATAPKPQAAPKLLRDVAPRYPDGGGRMRQSGQVQVAFTIDPQGGVASPRVVSSNLPAAFDRAALAAAARWKFEATGSSQPGSRTVRFDPPGG